MTLGFLGIFKKRPPNIKTLGQWLWNNDVALLDQILENATVGLFKELVESGVIQVEGGRTLLDEHEVDMIAGHLANLLDGGYLLRGYAPRISDSRLLSIATATRDLVLTREYPNLTALSTTTGILIAIRLWYSRRFAECVSVATHIISISTEKGAAEPYRVRGFAYFASGDYTAALADMLEAQKREPGLVGINEPIKALRGLTNTSASGDREHEPAGLGMNRATMTTFSRILAQRAAASGNQAPANELVDFGAMAQLADRMLKSKALESRQIEMGNVIDLAKCAMSSTIALNEYLLTEDRASRDTLPPEQEMRDAFGACMFFLRGTIAINPNIDPRFNRGVEDLQREVDALFARLDDAKFDL